MHLRVTYGIHENFFDTVYFVPCRPNKQARLEHSRCKPPVTLMLACVLLQFMHGLSLGMDAEPGRVGATGELVCRDAGGEVRRFVADIGKTFSQDDG